jgi:DNA-binding NarL/FixJ family response regulator
MSPQKTVRGQSGADIRVLVADDHAIVRRGLREILSDVPEVSNIGEAVDGDQALQEARTGEWDVLVLDIAMPGRSALEYWF